jgi:Type II secretion system (T2SS), protein M subtype b
MTLTSGPLSRFIALTLLVIATIPVGTGVLWLVSWSKSQTEEIDDTLQRYDRFRSIASFDVNSLGTVSDGQSSSVYLGNGPHAVLTSSLQSRLREIALQLGVEVLQAAELTPTESIAGLLKIGIRVEMSGPAQGIHGVLKQLDHSVPWLFLDNMQLRAGYADPSQGEPPLTLGADIWGVIPSTPQQPLQQ